MCTHKREDIQGSQGGRPWVGLLLLGLLNASTMLAATADPAAKAGEAAAAEAVGPTGAWEWLKKTDRLTGTWGGWRTRLEEKGVTLNFYLNEFFAWKDSGGVSGTSAGRESGSFDTFLQLNSEKLGLWRGGELLLQVKNNWGFNINPLVGALGDPIDDADGDHPIYIDQLWYGHSSPGKTVQFRIGYLDEQVLVDRNAYANNEDRQFMSTFLDNNSAIIPLKIGPGAAVLYNPADWIGFVVSMADADAQLFHSSLDTTFDGDFNFMGYFETQFKTRIPGPSGVLAGNYRVGLLIDPRDKTVFGSDAVDGSDEGFYLSLDQQVFAEPDDSKQGVGLFARYGWRPGNVNRIEHFWSVGAQYQGLIPSRDKDILGFGMYSAIGSDSYQEFVNPAFDRENAYEAYYSVQLTPAIAVTPGGQFIEQPGGLRSQEDTWVFALRLRMVF